MVENFLRAKRRSRRDDDDDDDDDEEKEILIHERERKEIMGEKLH